MTKVDRERQVLEFIDTHGNVEPSSGRIEHDLGCSGSTVNQVCRRLVERGVLESFRRWGQNGWGRSGYRTVFRRVSK